MHKLLILCFLLAITACKAQLPDQQTIINDKKAILEVMKSQEKAWSAHDLEGFMQGYWRNDSLKFFGSNGITYGWEQTLANYKKGYPTTADSGTLSFKIHDISPISKEAYWVMGEYFLSRTVGDANGTFMIIFKKINGAWKIVSDMSCG